MAWMTGLAFEDDTTSDKKRTIFRNSRLGATKKAGRLEVHHPHNRPCVSNPSLHQECSFSMLLSHKSNQRNAASWATDACCLLQPSSLMAQIHNCSWLSMDFSTVKHQCKLNKTCDVKNVNPGPWIPHWWQPIGSQSNRVRGSLTLLCSRPELNLEATNACLVKVPGHLLAQAHLQKLQVLVAQRLKCLRTLNHYRSLRSDPAFTSVSHQMWHQTLLFKLYLE